MHERGVFQNLMRKIDSVARAEGASRVTQITVRLGPALRLTPEHFQEHFDWESRGTLAEGAKVRIEDWAEDDGDAAAILLESVDLAAPE
jgi:Zn finger protein HypA/HybF involved in hydrogenase expression